MWRWRGHRKSYRTDAGDMTDQQLEKLREYARLPKDKAKRLSIACNDGVILQGLALVVSDEDRDVIFELHSSNNPAKYKDGTFYLIKWDDIADVHEF